MAKMLCIRQGRGVSLRSPAGGCWTGCVVDYGRVIADLVDIGGKDFASLELRAPRCERGAVVSAQNATHHPSSFHFYPWVRQANSPPLLYGTGSPSYHYSLLVQLAALAVPSGPLPVCHS
jgi:hypothetical protein